MITMLRGTIWITPKGDDEIPQTVPVLRFVKTLDVPDPERFKRIVREQYPSPDVAVEFGPIGEPWV